MNDWNLKTWQMVVLTVLTTAVVGAMLGNIGSPASMDFVVGFIITLLALRWLDISRRPPGTT